MTKVKKSLRTIKGEEIYDGDTIRISTHIRELNEDFIQEGVFRYNEKEDYFHLEDTPEVQVNIWDHLELVRTKNVRKIVKLDK